MARDDNTSSTKIDRSARERLSHSARIARIALQRRDAEAIVDREMARRVTVARLHAGAML